MWSLLALAAASVLDIAVGCPPWKYHPVRIIGRLAVRFEAFWRRRLPGREKLAGAGFNLSVLIVVFAASGWLYLLPWPWRWPLEALLLHFCLAYRCLADEGRGVLRPLEAGDLPAARERLRWLVSRDVRGEDARGLTRGAVETVTENASDGVVAPLFWFAVGGAPLALLYKAVNTLDSVVGYRSPRYLKFGWFSARLDDAANYLPARLTGLLLVAAAGVLGGSPRRALAAWRRDSRKGPSPNGGIPIVTFAGAADVALGGDCVNPDGTVVRIPLVGGARREIVPADLRLALRYLAVASLLAAALTAAARVFLF